MLTNHSAVLEPCTLRAFFDSSKDAAIYFFLHFATEMASSEPTYTEDELRQIEESVQNKSTAKKNKAAEKKTQKTLA